MSNSVCFPHTTIKQIPEIEFDLRHKMFYKHRQCPTFFYPLPWKTGFSFLFVGYSRVLQTLASR